MKNLLKAFVVLTALWVTPSFGQLGQLQSGQTWGNPGSTQAPPQPTLIGPLLDKGYCTTAGSVLFRGVSVWQCITPAANSVFITSGSNVPSYSTTLPSGLAIPAPALSGTITGNPTFSGNITHSGQLIVQGGTAPASGAGNTVMLGTLAASPTLSNTGQAVFYNSIAGGAVTQGDGTTFDVAFVNKSGSTVFGIPTGTTKLNFAGLALGTCVNAIGLDSGNNTVLISCPGAAASIQIGTTTITGSPTVGDCLSTATGPLLGQLVCAQLNVQDQTLSGGANVTSLSLSTGNITVDCGARPLQFITNNGAFTITAPANDGSCMLLITNGASASTVTFSGFTVNGNTGEALTTTNTNKFTVSIWRINGTSSYTIKALQ